MLGQLKEFVHKSQSYRPMGRNMLQSSHGRDQEHIGRSERKKSQNLSRKREEKSLDQPRWVIYTVVGGFDGGGAITSARKRHLRQVRSINIIS